MLSLALTIRPNPNIFNFNRFFTSMASSSSKSIVAEYAKSGRSSCKKCAGKIEARDLRLGLVSKDPRGFDMTKWHHLHCLPISSNSISSPDAILGFSSLKSSDQEALRKLVSEPVQFAEAVLDGKKGALANPKKRPSEKLEVQKGDEDANGELDQSHVKKRKVQNEDEDANSELDQKHVKKRKLLASEEGGKLEIAFSASEIKNKYKDATLLPKWKAFQTVIFLERDEGLHDSSKIAAFDFDGCLANTSVYRVGADAWSLMYPSIPEKLQSLYNDGYKLVIFTNEANIELWKNKRQSAVDSKIGRLENFIKRVKLPIQVFIACGHSKSQPNDPFRKPKPGMWYILEKHFNSGLPIDMDQSFYVGDAAGRRNDHSDADIKFAEAVGLKFYLPEEFFTSD